MTTITREQLHERARRKVKELEFAITQSAFTSIRDGLNEELELARIALASLTAEPVAWTDAEELRDLRTVGFCEMFAVEPVSKDADMYRVIPLYTDLPVSERERIRREHAEWSDATFGDVGPIGPLKHLSKDEYACCIAADMWNACRSAILQGAEPVSQTYKLPELIEGMEVSVDVSTCDFDAGHRYFGTVTEVSELDSAKNGYILLVQDAEPNFDVNGNSPVTPDGWISCSERMPDNDESKPIAIFTGKCLGQGMFVATYDDDGFFDYWEGMEIIGVTHWMPLPEPPQEVNRG